MRSSITNNSTANRRRFCLLATAIVAVFLTMVYFAPANPTPQKPSTITGKSIAAFEGGAEPMSIDEINPCPPDSRGEPYCIQAPSFTSTGYFDPPTVTICYGSGIGDPSPIGVTMNCPTEGYDWSSCCKTMTATNDVGYNYPLVVWSTMAPSYFFPLTTDGYYRGPGAYHFTTTILATNLATACQQIVTHDGPGFTVNVECPTQNSQPWGTICDGPYGGTIKQCYSCGGDWHTTFGWMYYETVGPNTNTCCPVFQVCGIDQNNQAIYLLGGCWEDEITTPYRQCPMGCEDSTIQIVELSPDGLDWSHCPVVNNQKVVVTCPPWGIPGAGTITTSSGNASDYCNF